MTKKEKTALRAKKRQIEKDIQLLTNKKKRIDKEIKSLFEEYHNIQRLLAQDNESARRSNKSIFDVGFDVGFCDVI